jgi:Tfp pilus assembly protein PilX
MFLHQQNQNNQSGQLLVLVLVFGAIFLIIVTSFISSVVSQARVVDVRFEQQRASEIAEAGLNYYAWFLAHNPGDISGGGTFVYEDPEDGRVGTYELNVAGESYCGQISTVEVTSTGRTDANPDALAIISATYKRPTVAEYAFITNTTTRYGSSRVITGPVHSNQQVQMDGFHNSFVGSGVATLGGNDGVYTTSGNATPGLFRFPITGIDFFNLTIDMIGMRTSAQADGIFYGPSGDWGYRVVFNGDSTIDVYRVTNTQNYWSFSSTEDWHRGERNDITGMTQIANNLPIPVDCPVLFFEDKVWIEGAINGKVAIAAGLNTSNTQNNIVVHDDVSYIAGTNAGLVAIAEDDVDMGIDVPTDLIANGIYIAQNGRFGRNHYCENCGEWTGPFWNRVFTNYGLPNNLDPFVSRDSLTRLGSVVGNVGAGTEWMSGTTHLSGFRSRVTSFDRDQIDDPPPLTPSTNDAYELQDWRSEG